MVPLACDETAVPGGICQLHPRAAAIAASMPQAIVADPVAWCSSRDNPALSRVS